jgi:hypothetical protein
VKLIEKTTQNTGGQIGPNGAKAIAEVLKANSSLKQLDLSSTMKSFLSFEG